MSLEFSFPDIEDSDLDLDIFETNSNTDDEQKQTNVEEMSESETSSDSDDFDIDLSSLPPHPAVRDISTSDLDRLTVLPTTETKIDTADSFRKELDRENKQRKFSKPKSKKETKPRSKPRWIRVTKDNREKAVTKHKYHLLLWLAHHRFVYSFTKNQFIRCIVLSLLPQKLLRSFSLPNEHVKETKKRRKRMDESTEQRLTEDVVDWFHSRFTITSESSFLSEESIINQIHMNKLGLLESNIVLLVASELCGLVARYIGTVDVIGVHVSGSSIEHAGLEREVHTISKGQLDILSTMHATTCWLEILCNSTNTWLPVEIQSQTIGNTCLFELSRMLKNNSPCIYTDDSKETVSPKKKSKKNVKGKHKVVQETELCNHDGCLYYCVALCGDMMFDVTWRYSLSWLHAIRNRMIDPTDAEWWTETLECFLTDDNDDFQHYLEIDQQERDEKENEIPIPSTLAAFQKHPLYCLTKNIGKYQEIYPKKEISTFRDQKVFYRSHLHNLHSPEKWLEKGRSIKKDEIETPIKEVDSIKASMDPFGVHAQTKLYGRWQTERFQPLTVLPGEKIPTNQYGNVYLFEPWMIPRGCVHLRLWNSVITVAKKLNIDAPPAMVGWKKTKGWRSVPDIQGVIVLKEYAETLEQAHYDYTVTRRERKKILYHLEISNRWKRFTSRMMITDALKKKYLTPAL